MALVIIYSIFTMIFGVITLATVFLKASIFITIIPLFLTGFFFYSILCSSRDSKKTKENLFMLSEKARNKGAIEFAFASYVSGLSINKNTGCILYLFNDRVEIEAGNNNFNLPLSKITDMGVNFNTYIDRPVGYRISQDGRRVRPVAHKNSAYFFDINYRNSTNNTNNANVNIDGVAPETTTRNWVDENGNNVTSTTSSYSFNSTGMPDLNNILNNAGLAGLNNINVSNNMAGTNTIRFDMKKVPILYNYKVLNIYYIQNKINDFIKKFNELNHLQNVNNPNNENRTYNL